MTHDLIILFVKDPTCGKLHEKGHQRNLCQHVAESTESSCRTFELPDIDEVYHSTKYNLAENYMSENPGRQMQIYFKVPCASIITAKLPLMIEKLAKCENLVQKTI